MSSTAAAAPPPPLSRRRGSAVGDRIFAGLCRGAGILVLILLGAIIVELFIGGLPTFRAFGVAFVWGDNWDPVAEEFGALVPVFGTVATSILALLLAVPVAFGIAYFLTEIAPPALRRPVGTAIELLAAVPSIIFGMWGFFVIVPLMAQHVQPAIIDTIGELPLVGFLFAGPPFGTGLFTAALILAIMVMPFIMSVAREVLLAVPASQREAALALGATRWEATWTAVVPYARSGIIGAVILGLGRALGETMAVTMLIGNRHEIAASLFAPGYTMAAAIANEFTEAGTDLHFAALAYVALVLFLVTGQLGLQHGAWCGLGSLGGIGGLGDRKSVV